LPFDKKEKDMVAIIAMRKIVVMMTKRETTTLTQKRKRI
jgi:hypothetical protein